MSDNRFKEKMMEVPIENWQTAPLSNIEHLKAVSRVHIPSEMDVYHAKEYVDDNQK